MYKFALSFLLLHEFEQNSPFWHESIKDIRGKLKVASRRHCSQIQDQAAGTSGDKIFESLVELYQALLGQSCGPHVTELFFNQIGLKRMARRGLLGLCSALNRRARTKPRQETLDCGLVNFLIR